MLLIANIFYIFKMEKAETLKPDPETVRKDYGKAVGVFLV